MYISTGNKEIYCISMVLKVHKGDDLGETVLKDSLGGKNEKG